MQETATDWTRYYESPFITALLTRRITARLLVKLISAAGFPDGGRIIEAGGGNSSFCMPLMHILHASHYLAIDNNPRGVELFRQKHPGTETETLCTDLFSLDAASIEPADLVFSIGLVEHFPEGLTKTAIRRHFELAKPGGLVLVSFPVPTPCYRLIRGTAESLGLWRFPDERPIQLEDAVHLCAEHGDVIAKRLNRAILLTQGIVLVRKPG